MALGTSEATPLQMASAYTTFANLGERSSPLAINRVTNGEGTTVVVPNAEKKRVIQPDVSYIMNDIMKDVINRGTAAELRAWGFKNVAGKTGIAGKTGTSRDGWFAGFTPEIVCVVYVGFDDGSDLGMKGSDSAMPIWADFMKEALAQNPDWNGDWTMPDSVRKAEIDIRNGSLIKEIGGFEQTEPTPTPTPTPLILNTNSEFDSELEPENEPKEIYVTDVPPEFRRVELFIGGTLPNRSLIPSEDLNLEENQDLTKPQGSPTPFTTWEDARKESPPNKGGSETLEKNVSVSICDFTGMKAGEYCQKKHQKSFKESEQPREFCNIHIYPPN